VKKEFWENLSPTDAQSERLLQRIREKAGTPVRPRCRPLRIAAVIAAVLVMTTVAGVIAAPAMIRYFVPHLGMVEVPESTAAEETVPYMFMMPHVSPVSGNRYRMGYLYGDTATVYIYIPCSEEYRKATENIQSNPTKEQVDNLTAARESFRESINAHANEHLQVEELQQMVRNESTEWERMAEYKLTFTGLDKTAAQQGISFMGDTICFETPNIEYEVYTKEHQGVTLSLIPLADDYSVFACSVEVDKEVAKSASLIYDKRHMTAGYSQPFFTFVDAHGHHFKAQMVDNIIYLDPKKCDVPVTKLVTNSLAFSMVVDRDGREIRQTFVMSNDWSFMFDS